MSSALELAVVRVFKSGGGVVGSGFLISSQYILTCAHVVAYSLTSSKETAKRLMKKEEKPTQVIEIDFPVLSVGRKLQTEVIFWFPLKTNETLQDIAVLKLTNPNQLPKNAVPINLISVQNENLWEHHFRALGFPKKGSNGEWATGVLRGRVGKGRIQLEDIKETGLRLEEGFSGTPIWDEKLQGVVGMAVTEDYARPEAKVAFMTPTDILLQVGDLAQVCKVNGRVQEANALLQDYFKVYQKEIRYAYRLSLPENTIPLSSGQSLYEFPESLAEMIQNLNNYSQDNYSLLERFIGFLLLQLQDLDKLDELQNKLDKWLQRHLQNHQDLIAALRKEQATKNQQKSETGEAIPCLLVGVFERSRSFLVRAWLIQDIQTCTLKNYQGFDSLTNEENISINEKGIVIDQNKNSENKYPKNLTELLQRFLANAESRCESSIKRIQIFLPYKLIDQDIKSIEHWLIDPNVPEYVQTPFGSESEVSVRFSERLKSFDTPDKYVKKSREKWKILVERQERKAIKILHPLGISNLNQLHKKISSDDVLAVKLTEMLQASKLKSILEIFFYAGIPVALWLRPEAETYNCDGSIDDVCQTCSCWSMLPEAIKTKRYEAWNEDDETHIGNHLSLLWDDPNLVPPANELEMP